MNVKGKFLGVSLDMHVKCELTPYNNNCRVGSRQKQQFYGKSPSQKTISDDVTVRLNTLACKPNKHIIKVGIHWNNIDDILIFFIIAATQLQSKVSFLFVVFYIIFYK